MITLLLDQLIPSNGRQVIILHELLVHDFGDNPQCMRRSPSFGSLNEEWIGVSNSNTGSVSSISACEKVSEWSGHTSYNTAIKATTPRPSMRAKKRRHGQARSDSNPISYKAAMSSCESESHGCSTSQVLLGMQRENNEMDSFGYNAATSACQSA